MASGLSTEEGEGKARLIIPAAISSAVIGGFVWGAMVDKIGPKRTLDYVLYLWMATFIGAASVGLLGLPW